MNKINDKREIICYPPTDEERALLDSIKQAFGLTTDRAALATAILLATGHATRPAFPFPNDRIEE